MSLSSLTGDRLLLALNALANPHRLRILAMLTESGRNYVSQLARDVGISRPLLHMHLQKLEAAGLIRGALELSEDGKAMKYYSVEPFLLELSPQRITELTRTLTVESVIPPAAGDD